MKKILLICLTALLFLPIANKAFAADDLLISAVSFDALSNDYSATTDYSYNFTAADTIPAGTTIYLMFYDNSNVLDPTEVGVNLMNFEPMTENVPINGYGYHDSSESIGFITLGEDLSAGDYTFVATNVSNPGSDMDLSPVLSTATFSSEMDYTAATEDLVIGESANTGKLASEYISSFGVELESSYVGIENTHTYTITTTDTLELSDTFLILFTGEDIGPFESGFDFSSASASSDDISLTCQPAESTENAVLECSLYADLAVGEHDLTVENVINSSTTATYSPSIVLGTSMGPDDDYVYASDVVIEEMSAPEKPGKKNLKTKNLKKKSGTLKWTAVADADYYKLRLEKYKSKTKKYKKIKLYKNITTNKKLVKKAKKTLKAGNKYRYKVRACNDAGCSAWSKYKKFKTKA